jgi:polysaccharide export outer membrane protein
VRFRAAVHFNLEVMKVMRHEITARRVTIFILSLALLLAGRRAAAQEAAGGTQAKALPPSPAAHPVIDRPAAGSGYLIGPGDVLAVHVWHEPEISGKVPVRTDGKISLPLVGELQAAGLTPESLQINIRKKLYDYIKNPEVAVVVEEMNSRQFNVMGEVQKPGNYPLLRPTRVLDALALAGGFRDFAKSTKIYILRRTPEGGTITVRFNYKNVVKGKDADVELLPGDTIVVP